MGFRTSKNTKSSTAGPILTRGGDATVVQDSNSPSLKLVPCPDVEAQQSERKLREVRAELAEQQKKTDPALWKMLTPTDQANKEDRLLKRPSELPKTLLKGTTNYKNEDTGNDEFHTSEDKYPRLPEEGSRTTLAVHNPDKHDPWLPAKGEMDGQAAWAHFEHMKEYYEHQSEPIAEPDPEPNWRRKQMLHQAPKCYQAHISKWYKGMAAQREADLESTPSSALSFDTSAVRDCEPPSSPTMSSATFGSAPPSPREVDLSSTPPSARPSTALAVRDCEPTSSSAGDNVSGASRDKPWEKLRRIQHTPSTKPRTPGTPDQVQSRRRVGVLAMFGQADMTGMAPDLNLLEPVTKANVGAAEEFDCLDVEKDPREDEYDRPSVPVGMYDADEMEYHRCRKIQGEAAAMWKRKIPPEKIEEWHQEAFRCSAEEIEQRRLRASEALVASRKILPPKAPAKASASAGASGPSGGNRKRKAGATAGPAKKRTRAEATSSAAAEAG